MVQEIVDTVKIRMEDIPENMHFLAERHLWANYKPTNGIPIGYVHDEIRIVLPEVCHPEDCKFLAWHDHHFYLQRLGQKSPAAQILQMSGDLFRPIEPINLVFGLISTARNLNDGLSNIFVIRTSCQRKMLLVISGKSSWTIKIRSAQYVEREYLPGSRIFTICEPWY